MSYENLVSVNVTNSLQITSKVFKVVIKDKLIQKSFLFFVMN